MREEVDEFGRVKGKQTGGSYASHTAHYNQATLPAKSSQGTLSKASLEAIKRDRVAMVKSLTNGT